MPEKNPSDESERTESAANGPTSGQHSWWWSPTVAIVIGIVVITFQVGPLTAGGLWLNWVVAALGIVLAANGVVRLVRAYPR
jgi:amino acid transporter